MERFPQSAKASLANVLEHAAGSGKADRMKRLALVEKASAPIASQGWEARRRSTLERCSHNQQKLFSPMLSSSGTVSEASGSKRRACLQKAEALDASRWMPACVRMTGKTSCTHVWELLSCRSFKAQYGARRTIVRECMTPGGRSTRCAHPTPQTQRRALKGRTEQQSRRTPSSQSDPFANGKGRIAASRAETPIAAACGKRSCTSSYRSGSPPHHASQRIHRWEWAKRAAHRKDHKLRIDCTCISVLKHCGAQHILHRCGRHSLPQRLAGSPRARLLRHAEKSSEALQHMAVRSLLMEAHDHGGGFLLGFVLFCFLVLPFGKNSMGPTFGANGIPTNNQGVACSQQCHFVAITITQPVWRGAELHRAHYERFVPQKENSKVGLLFFLCVCGKKCRGNKRRQGSSRGNDGKYGVGELPYCTQSAEQVIYVVAHTPTHQPTSRAR